jgi:ferredoxin
MSEEHPNLSRRKFMVVGSATIASPLLFSLADSVPAAAAATFKKGTKVYFVTGDCVGCHVCKVFCPAKAIFYGERRMAVDQDKCIHCGTCYNECPVSAVSETVV